MHDFDGDITSGTITAPASGDPVTYVPISNNFYSYSASQSESVGFNDILVRPVATTNELDVYVKNITICPNCTGIFYILMAQYQREQQGLVTLQLEQGVLHNICKQQIILL